MLFKTVFESFHWLRVICPWSVADSGVIWKSAMRWLVYGCLNIIKSTPKPSFCFHQPRPCAVRDISLTGLLHLGAITIIFIQSLLARASSFTSEVLLAIFTGTHCPFLASSLSDMLCKLSTSASRRLILSSSLAKVKLLFLGVLQPWNLLPSIE